jgi:hypothetical protein
MCVVIDSAKAGAAASKKLTRHSYNLYLLPSVSIPSPAYYAPASQQRDLSFVCNHTRYYKYHLDQCAVFILRRPNRRVTLNAA